MTKFETLLEAVVKALARKRSQARAMRENLNVVRVKMRSLDEEHQTLIKTNDIAMQQLFTLKEEHRKEI